MLNLYKILDRFLWSFNHFLDRVSYIDIAIISFCILPLGINIYINNPLRKYIIQQEKIIYSEQVNKDDILKNQLIFNKEVEVKDKSSDFFNFLPPQYDVNKNLFYVKKIILKNKLEIESVEYVYEKLDNIPVYQVKAKIKLKGNYYNQRKLIYDLYSQLKNLSISKINLTNDKGVFWNMDFEIKLFFYRDVENNHINGGSHESSNI